VNSEISDLVGVLVATFGVVGLVLHLRGTVSRREPVALGLAGAGLVGAVVLGGLALGWSSLAILVGLVAAIVAVSLAVRFNGGSRASTTRSGVVWATLLGSTDLLLGLGLPLGASGPGETLVTALVSPNFLWSIALQIALVALLARPELDPRVRALFVGQAAIVALSPTALPGVSVWTTVSAALGSALFVALFVVALQFVYRTKQLTASLSRSIALWAFAAAVTGLGWFVWHLYGSEVILALSVVLQAAIAFGVTLVDRSPPTENRLPWLLHPFWVFEILLFTFLAEFFLGALLDLLIAGPTFLQFIPFVPTSGGEWSVVGTTVYNGLWFGAAILASAWFLIVMGFTLGALVIFKIRETRERALRYRLGLMIAVYALAAIYIPSLASSTPITTNPTLANLPVVGWGFGLRSGGPFESTAFLAILLMYVFVGVLTVLFGRKALCSVMCGAAMLYQGTTVSEMRGFNQTSRVGRYFLGSQLSTAYLVASSLALVSLFATSVLGVLHMLPAVTLANGEVDTSALPLPVELYFGGLWFAMFVSIPYVGTYNCATTGFCHWGALSIPFAKVGLFRLKVKDKKICQQCTTFDCAKACPVGLVDMPLYFRTTGEYRSTKCCGVGDCVGACPYGNMYHQDVRFWLRRRASGRRVPSPAQRLPMAPSAAPTAPRASEAAIPSTGQL
jgi:polyferredoxin